MSKFRILFSAIIILCIFLVGCGTPYEDPTIYIDETVAFAGETVTVYVNIANNPGVAGAKIKITYDSELILKKAKEGAAFSDLDYTEPEKLQSGCVFNWDSEIGEATIDGIILKLRFTVPEDAEEDDEYVISCSYEVGDIYDEDLKDVNLDVVAGKITVI